jgi:16S rRNA (guanine966-N2)-methyltransferase
MRIVAGAHRGRTLVAPKGHSTRPTADRTRQALFNVLEHAPWGGPVEGLSVIDLFAGSGALGLEALSRGASFCLMADGDPSAVAAIIENVAALRLENSSAVRRLDATRLGAFSSSLMREGRGEKSGFDLAFLDPPYAKGLADPALASMADGGWLAPGALVVVERGAQEGDFTTIGYEVLDNRVWGAARVWFLRA